MTLKFLALQGAPYIYDISRLRVNGCLANKYGKPPVFANTVLADLLFCSPVVVTICIVLTGLNWFDSGYDQDTLVIYNQHIAVSMAVL
jgi:hypothetical protein